MPQFEAPGIGLSIEDFHFFNECQSGFDRIAIFKLPELAPAFRQISISFLQPPDIACVQNSAACVRRLYDGME